MTGRDQSTSPMIEVEGLVRRFGSFTAVNRISFSVARGEVFGLLGANGAGKTTTIRMICGLLPPTAGRIFVDGIPVHRQPRLARTRIGYLSQRFSLYEDLSPEENVRFFSALYRVEDTRTAHYLARLSSWLGEGARRPVRTLPLGFRQRVGLMCALLHDPPLLILDEPTSGVDPVGRQEFWEEIYRQSSKGKTILVTTHYMEEAEYCHRVAIMHQGKVLVEGPPQEIMASSGTRTLQEAFIHLVSSGGTP
ncbi:ABC transporter ATP-binding protein [Spirochaeta thermophila]|uniref:Transporter n=1 Tax=Winmispira thermophila (strain ATCC 49972 / DSM 6192 / RI 19.B1) TaxID=665571 RepID=E0RQB6_WINT6|nr:ABC transporter ATP-binding protein [Spirochaeta thermophila]ADN02892.1 transporter [Spirochaeta thermophila DSM 6192]